MSLTFLIEAPSIPQEDRIQFENDANTIYAGYAALCAKFGVPVAAIQMVLSDDLQEAVRERLKSETYKARREVVEVTAKCLYNSRAGESQDLVIVVASWPWNNSTDPANRLVGISVLAHEFMHPLLDQLWSQNGSVVDPAESDDEDARNAVAVFDEYWADTLAFMFLQGLQVHVTLTLSDGSVVNLEPSALTVGGFVKALQEFLQRAHPSWPDTIQSYREWQIDLETMIKRIATSLGECSILMAHTQAHLDATQPDTESPRSIFELEELRDLPAVQLYVGEPWREFWACLKRAPIAEDAQTVSTYYADLVSACRTMFLQIWRALGVEIEARDVGAYYHVGEPLR